MSIHLIEAIASCPPKAADQILEQALAVHGFRVSSKRQFDARSAGATKPSTLRFSRRRFPRDAPFLWITDRETGLEPDWWTTLSALLDGFVVRYEKRDYYDVHRRTCALSGKILEDKTYMPDSAIGLRDARTHWSELVALFLEIVPGTEDEAQLIEGMDWWLEPCDRQPAPQRCSGGRALLANVAESAFAPLAAGGLNDWRWRPWVSSLDVPAIDLWRPAGFDLACVKQWAESLGCIAVTWDIEDETWPWAHISGADRIYQGVTRDITEFVQEVRMGTTTVGEGPLRIGGRGVAGWRF